MAYVSFIKYCNIPKKVFEERLKYLKELIAIPREEDTDCDYELSLKDKRNDITYDEFTIYENNELPNADILYTFDNDIINEYYRYE